MAGYGDPEMGVPRYPRTTEKLYREGQMDAKSLNDFVAPKTFCCWNGVLEG